jgi:hypothetical protein
MGSSHAKNGKRASEQLVTITTDVLKERLNRLYGVSHGSRQKMMSQFDHLWDLKEHALLEKATSIEVPRSWMDELDHALSQNRGN